MRVGTVTGNRADLSAIQMVFNALSVDERFVAFKYDVTPSLDGDEPRDLVFAARNVCRDVLHEFEMSQPDLVLLHGDRYEILAVALAASIMAIPIAHIGGGDLTPDSQDNNYRAAITKLAHLHFPANEDAAARILQMGEDPSRVHVVGCPAVDRVRQTWLLSRQDAFAAVGLQGCDKALLVAFHPSPLTDTGKELAAVLGALRSVARDVGLILVGPNADAGHGKIAAAFAVLAAEHPNTVFHPNLGNEIFLACLKHCSALVGNSSAGISEAPTYGTPVVNVGARQNGRLRASNVIDVPAHAGSISRAIDAALRGPMVNSLNPYGDGHATQRIIAVLSEISNPKALLRKEWFDPQASRERVAAVCGQDWSAAAMAT